MPEQIYVGSLFRNSNVNTAKVVSFSRIIRVCTISGRSISNDNTGKNVHICINDVNYIPIELIIGFLWYTNSTSIDSL